MMDGKVLRTPLRNLLERSMTLGRTKTNVKFKILIVG